VEIEVSEADLALVIGRRGQNARLTQRLLGYKIEIVKEKAAVADLDTKKAGAAASLGQIPGIGDELARRLVAAGFTSVEVFAGAGEDDLVDAGFSSEEAHAILEKIHAHLEGNRAGGR
jgi:N utilization substance protein A